MKKELNEEGLHTYFLVTQEDGAYALPLNELKGSFKQNRSLFILLALRNGGTRTARALEGFIACSHFNQFFFFFFF